MRKLTVWGMSVINPLIRKFWVTIRHPMAAPTDRAPILPQVFEEEIGRPAAHLQGRQKTVH